jgi:hypothetical protein
VPLGGLLEMVVLWGEQVYGYQGTKTDESSECIVGRFRKKLASSGSGAPIVVGTKFFTGAHTKDTVGGSTSSGLAVSFGLRFPLCACHALWLQKLLQARNMPLSHVTISLSSKLHDCHLSDSLAYQCFIFVGVGRVKVFH